MKSRTSPCSLLSSRLSFAHLSFLSSPTPTHLLFLSLPFPLCLVNTQLSIIGSNQSYYDRDRRSRMYPGEYYPRGGAGNSNYGYPGQEGYSYGYGGGGSMPGGYGYQDPYYQDPYMGGYGGAGFGYGGMGGGWDPRLDYAYDVPPVSWMPQQGWGAYDFARAQGGRGISQGYFDEFQSGMSRWFDNYQNDELFARQAHRQVFMMRDFGAPSRELGAAAAYEAYLKWDRAQYERTWGRRGTEGREGLMGFAFGEAHRLADRLDLDSRRREKVLRYATATASNLWNEQWDDYSDYRDYGGGGSRRLGLGMGGPGLGRRGSFGYGGRDPYLDGPRGRRRSFDDGYVGGSMGMIGPGGGMMGGGGGGVGMMGGYGGAGMGIMPGGSGTMGGGYPSMEGAMYEDDYRRGGGGRDGPLQIGYGGSYGPRGW